MLFRSVCASAIPSFELRIAWFMPLTCEVMLVAMAMPAASSLALLIRLPVDKRSIAMPSDLAAEFEALAARIALILVLMTVMK